MVILEDNLNSLVILVTLLLCVFCCSVVTVSSVTPWIVAHQAPLSMGFPRQEYWSGLPFPPPGDLPNPRIKPASAALQVASLPLSHQRSPERLAGLLTGLSRWSPEHLSPCSACPVGVAPAAHRGRGPCESPHPPIRAGSRQ